jgi:hypothetical protein
VGTIRVTSGYHDFFLKKTNTGFLKSKMHVSKSIQLFEMLTFTSILPFEMIVCNFHQIRMPSTTRAKIAEAFFCCRLICNEQVLFDEFESCLNAPHSQGV